MIQSLLLRRLVSGIAMIMVVWCQTSAAAQGCLIALSAPAAQAATAAPCHEAATDNSSDTSRRDCATRCQSRDASLENAKIHLPVLEDFPPAVISTTVSAPAAICAAPNHQTAERDAPPPLILVYCRLLI